MEQNIVKILVELLELIRGNLMEYQKKILKNITKSDSNFAPNLVDHHLLPDIHFNGHGLINNNFYIPKKVINLYFSYILTPWLRDLNTNLHQVIAYLDL